MKRKSKKAEGMSFEVLISLVIGALILLAVFYFLFGNYIWDYVRNLPGNKYNDKDPPIKNISKDDLILSSYYKVGIILDGKYIKLCTRGDCGNLRDSKLYLNGDDRSGNIYTDINWAFDKKVGAMLNSRLVIDRDIFAGVGIYEKVKNELPDYSDLRNLDNSIYISGIFYRDKEYVVSADEKVFGIKFDYMNDNSGFGEKLGNLGEGDVVIVYINYTIGDFKITEVQLERVGNMFRVFATYSDSSGNSQTNLMDCNKNGWTWQTKYLNLNNIKESLTATLDANCKI